MYNEKEIHDLKEEIDIIKEEIKYINAKNLETTNKLRGHFLMTDTNHNFFELNRLRLKDKQIQNVKLKQRKLAFNFCFTIMVIKQTEFPDL